MKMFQCSSQTLLSADVNIGWNFYNFGYQFPNDIRRFASVPLSNIKAPARCILVGDADRYTLSSGAMAVVYIVYAPNYSSSYGVSRVHSNGGNWGFLDGHVEWRRPEGLRDARWWMPDASW
jgi:prepilin-type processing-associated H-X9-DG protein